MTFNKELNKLKNITNKLTENGYLVDRTTQWEFAFDAVPDLVVIVNPDFKIKFINKTFALRLGVERHELVDKYCYEVTNCENTSQRICKEANEACLTGVKKCKRTTFEAVWIEDHLQGWFNFTHSPIYDEEDNLLGFICVLHDITESKKIEDALRKSEERYRSLFENTGTATFVADEDMTVVQANVECAELTGYSRDEIVGKMKTTDFVPIEELERIKKYHSERRKKGTEVPSEYELKIIDKNGHEIDVFIQVGMIPETKQSIASIINITSQKLTEDALRKSEARFRALFSKGHDVNLISE